MTARTYVAIPAPHQITTGRFTAELSFPASVRRRAVQHHSIAVELARIYGVEASTPIKRSPRCSFFDENGGHGDRSGDRDERRLKVAGAPRALARYLAVLPRVLTSIERLATKAARAFGKWRRSLMTVLSGVLEDETPATLRTRATQFRAEVLGHLVTFIAQGAPEERYLDLKRPLWEQAPAIAAEVWQESGGVDPWRVAEDEVQEQLHRMRHLQLSVVGDQSADPADATQIPDTVEEFLTLTGPALTAPAEVAFGRGVIRCAPPRPSGTPQRPHVWSRPTCHRKPRVRQLSPLHPSSPHTGTSRPGSAPARRAWRPHRSAAFAHLPGQSRTHCMS